YCILLVKLLPRVVPYGNRSRIIRCLVCLGKLFPGFRDTQPAVRFTPFAPPSPLQIIPILLLLTLYSPRSAVRGRRASST
ncbi:uncharacterized protein P884DRAFT_215103, partial [Thermothelomyces heterothallicus CBS 202.75]|uniref:uncharacterized protein n=1 Tax=Thermothelomyces heterothallicus CBS 202.75 TaxID=1149848 RepID=UPI003742E5A8